MFRLAFTNNNRKLIVSRVPVVGSVYSPTISGHIHSSAACIDHWFDADDHSIHKSAPVPLTPVVRNARRLVHLLPETVFL